jgi:hypothetical protein
MRAPINLLRNPIAVLHQRYAIRYLASQMRNYLRGARNPGSQSDRLVVHSGFCAPCALLSDRSLQFTGALI